MLPAKYAVIDTEVIVPDRRGASDFHALQLDLAQGRSDRFVCMAFDLLYLDGYDLRALPLIERKQMLERLITDPVLSRNSNGVFAGGFAAQHP